MIDQFKDLLLNEKEVSNNDSFSCSGSEQSKQIIKEQKNKQISETKKATKLKRTTQDCKVYEFKIVQNKLSSTQSTTLKNIFIQSKWLSNYALAELNKLYASELKSEITKIDKKGTEYIAYSLKDKKAYYVKVKQLLNDIPKLKEVLVKVGFDTFETRSIEDIPSSVKAEIIKQLLSDFKSIAAARKKGKKTGACSFKKKVSSVNLKQYGNSHEIKSSHHYKLTKVGKVRVRGMKQLTSLNQDYELANAKLVSKPTGFFIKQTVYTNKGSQSELKNNSILTDKLAKSNVGIDFGIRTAMTLSDGIQFNINIPETTRLKRLQKKFNRSVSKLTQKLGVKKLTYKNKSNNHFKRIDKINKEYQKVKERRITVKRKVVSYVGKNYGNIVMQDESIHEWSKSKMKGYGRKVQNSVIGAIIGDLKKIPTSMILSKWIRSTGVCPDCNYTFAKEDFGLEMGILDCPCCSLTLPRDGSSSIVIEQNGTGIKIPLERRKFKLLEIKTSDILASVSLSSLVYDRRNPML